MRASDDRPVRKLQNGGGIPTIPLPNPGEGGPVAPVAPGQPGGGIPTIPLPSPGEGGPVSPGPRPPQPQPQPVREGRVRFLNAAWGYPVFTISVDSRVAASDMDFADATSYFAFASGFQRITVAGPDGYIYVQKSLPIMAGEPSTIAVINTASGLDLLQLSDVTCANYFNLSCYRVCHLAYYANPVDVLLAGGQVIYSDVRFKETTAFRRIRRGEYEFYLTETTPQPEALVSFIVDVAPNRLYTSYILSRGTSPADIQVVTLSTP